MMDDVWGNAWSQPEEDVAHNVPTKPKIDDVPAWSFPSAAAAKDEEADVGMPSWSTGELNWTEPSGQASLWSSSSATNDLTLGTDGWGASSDPSLKLDFARDDNDVDNTSFSSPISMNEDESNEEIEEEVEMERARSSTPDSVRTVTSPTINVDSSSPFEDTESTPPLDAHSITETPGSPDPFGQFEAGLASTVPSLDESGTTWTSPVTTFDDAGEDDAWGSAWGTPEIDDDDDEAPKDEWAVAREEKARRDRTVPPEVIAKIMDHLNDLSSELWPEKDKPKFELELGNWRNGLSTVDGLENLVEKTLPKTSFQPPIQFARSHSAKAMVKSVKLSKNLPIVRHSPMSHLFTAKSLAAWELSVKSKVDVQKDDIPAGWKMAEPEVKQEVKPALVEKRSGGLLSFFGKRASVVPSSSPVPATVSNESKRSLSLSREASSDATTESTAARSSTDATSLSSKMQQSPSMSSISSIQPPEIPSTSTASLPIAPPPSSSSPTTTSYSQAPEPTAEPATSPAPSAVSRFFNRFSRTKSDVRSRSSSPRSSIALSTDDLEFLSDIVPSHNEDADEDAQLNALTALVSSPAFTAKLPPPLAPPPLAPPPRPASVVRSVTPQAHPLPVLLPSAPISSSPLGDLESLATRDPVSKGSRDSGVLVPSLPPPLPPPLSPTSVASPSKPPTPSPLSGGVVRTMHSRTSSLSTPPWSPATSASPPPVPLSANTTGLGADMMLSLSMGSPSSQPHSGKLHTQSTSQSNLSPLSSIPPPPVEKSPNRIFVRPSPATYDDDDFADFQSPTSMSKPMMQFGQAQSSTSLSTFDVSFDPPSDQSMLHQQDMSQDDSFGDFGEFMSTPEIPSSPPRMTTSPLSPPLGPIGVPPPLPKKQTPANLKTLHTRKPSAADHEAAAKLVERAAQHLGRWPAPPSPVPELLSPPPFSGSGMSMSKGPSKLDQSLLDIGNESAVPQRTTTPTPKHSIALKPIAQITSSAASRVASPTLLPPPPISNPAPSLLDFGDFNDSSQSAPSQTLPPPAPAPLSSTPLPSSAGSAKGGLSAQDLSFFEGL